MQKVLDINQIKAMIIKHLNKKIISNDLLKLCLYHKFYYNNDIILYAKANARYISFCDFLNDTNIDIYHYLYEYSLNKYFIINIYPIYHDITISINGKESDADEFKFFFNDLDPNIMNYINSIKLLYTL